MKHVRYSLSFSLPCIVVGLCLLLSSCGRDTNKQQDGAAISELAVVNVLGPSEYSDAHIKGSINIPYTELRERVSGWDKNRRVVVYCANYMCSSSAEGAQQLKELGFKNVSAYEGGTAEWHSLGYPLEGPAKAGYLAQVGRKPDSHGDLMVIDAPKLKQEIEIAQKAGKLVKN